MKFTVYLVRRYEPGTIMWWCSHVIVATGEPMPPGAMAQQTFNTWAAAEAYCAQAAAAAGRQLWSEWRCG